MQHFIPSDSYFAAIPRPSCPECGTRMMLSRISLVLNKPDHDERSFECSNCGNEHTEIVKFK
jgi:hypothetical protein